MKTKKSARCLGVRTLRNADMNGWWVGGGVANPLVINGQRRWILTKMIKMMRTEERKTLCWPERLSGRNLVVRNKIRNFANKLLEKQ